VGFERGVIACAGLLAVGAMQCAPGAGAHARVAPRTAVATPSPAHAPIAHESGGRADTQNIGVPPALREEPHGPITIAAVGDVMLARTIGERITANPAQNPFEEVAPVLRGADIAVANLECAVGTGGAPVAKAFAFRAPPAALGVLADAGIDVVSNANNHAMDFGPDTLAETLGLLDERHIVHAGAGLNEPSAHRAGVVESHGYIVAFLGYVKVMVEGLGGFDTASWEAKGNTAGIAWADPARISQDVAAAKTAGADFVVVMLHSGFEQSQEPNIWQIDAAHAAIDAGASLVLGAHPHVLEGTAKYKHGFIAYSLGNFVFDGADVVSAILKVTLDREEGVTAVEWTPVLIHDGFPKLVDETTGTYVQNLIKGLSMPLGE
jgi:poly-gamma-glutamate synthesis protein (capsule biosynthesis protein)